MQQTASVASIKQGHALGVESVCGHSNPVDHAPHDVHEVIEWLSAIALVALLVTALLLRQPYSKAAMSQVGSDINMGADDGAEYEAPPFHCKYGPIPDYKPFVPGLLKDPHCMNKWIKKLEL